MSIHSLGGIVLGNIIFVTMFIRVVVNSRHDDDDYIIVKMSYNLIFVVPCIMLYSGEISPTRSDNCGFYSQWLYSTCFG